MTPLLAICTGEGWFRQDFQGGDTLIDTFTQTLPDTRWHSVTLLRQRFGLKWHSLTLVESL